MASLSEKLFLYALKLGLGNFLLFVCSNGCILILDREIYIYESKVCFPTKWVLNLSPSNWWLMCLCCAHIQPKVIRRNASGADSRNFCILALFLPPATAALNLRNKQTWRIWTRNYIKGKAKQILCVSQSRLRKLMLSFWNI